jgi:hypothetical protein
MAKIIRLRKSNIKPPPGIQLGAAWVKMEGNWLPCRECKVPVSGPRWNLQVKLLGPQKESEYNLCEPCYLKTIEDENIPR